MNSANDRIKMTEWQNCEIGSGAGGGTAHTIDAPNEETPAVLVRVKKRVKSFETKNDDSRFTLL